jgi:hypothetical protein
MAKEKTHMVVDIYAARPEGVLLNSESIVVLA